MQVPALTKVTVVVETVQTEEVALVKATVKLLDAVALKANVPDPRTRLDREPNVID